MKNTIVKSIALLSILVGIIVAIGWFLDIAVLTSISPDWIRMKFATAICFVFTGITVFFLSFEREKMKETRQIALIIFPMFIVLIMGTLFLGSIFGFQTGMENIAFKDRHEAVTPIFQGRPSLATMINFLLISILAFSYNFMTSTKKLFLIVGGIMCAIGTMGILGYLTKIPFLYFEIPGISNAIAVHTTILFALIGLSVILLGTNKDTAPIGGLS